MSPLRCFIALDGERIARVLWKVGGPPPGFIEVSDAAQRRLLTSLGPGRCAFRGGAVVAVVGSTAS